MVGRLPPHRSGLRLLRACRTAPRTRVSALEANARAADRKQGQQTDTLGPAKLAVQTEPIRASDRVISPYSALIGTRPNDTAVEVTATVPKPVGDTIGKRIRTRSAEAAFPYRRNAPIRAMKGIRRVLVAHDVAFELRAPEVSVGRRHATPVTALMAMPEATVDEGDSLVTGEDKIGLAGQVRCMQAIANTGCMELLPKQPLGPRIFAANARHHP